MLEWVVERNKAIGRRAAWIRKVVGRWVGRIGLFSAVSGALCGGLTVAFVAYRVLHRITPTSDVAAAPIDITKLALAVVAGVGGVVALVIAYRRQRDVEQSRFVERFGAAAAQLGASDVAVRIAGVYAMASVADESDGLRRQQCIDVLCGYLRLPYTPELGGNHQTKEVLKHPTPDAGSEREQHFEYRQDDREVRKTIVRAIVAHLRPNAEYIWSASDFDFCTAHFEDSDFNGATFSGDVRFEDATFTDDTLFGGAKFSGITSFNNATFSGDAWFKEARFSGITSFDRATFSGDAEFEDATFTDDAGFVDATFSGDARFADATFCRDASFRNATFSGDARFVDTTFSRNALFGDAKFSLSAWFPNATFSGEAWFANATFSGDTWFKEATFSGDTAFRNATFSGDTSFKEATFSGDTAFRNATFTHDTTFKEATFSGETSFKEAKFCSDTSFVGAKFSGITSFDHATFSGDTRFARATFSGITSFAAPKQWGPPPPMFDWDANVTQKPAHVEPQDWPPATAPPSTHGE
ncbi:pentapeptide repeat-containing protein [Nocardia xishanensis]|uniref:pentapeptide repeat-containing protein n=1 Tax=Nocardia xishanensis TaxID=238964 RepID=UPI0033C35A72